MRVFPHLRSHCEAPVRIRACCAGVLAPLTAPPAHKLGRWPQVLPASVTGAVDRCRHSSFWPSYGFCSGGVASLGCTRASQSSKGREAGALTKAGWASVQAADAAALPIAISSCKLDTRVICVEHMIRVAEQKALPDH